ncbi:FMP40 (YPL222W) [Zygosaccharomyces parabailii]|uniref:Selenoprotein O n=1 Tax=Zygosaccharomyces bailii (strain CLIB 213 / ATCC 58445 / CBS 680 / BCRC 21525 / NBRC 1098 / NCYC 1416 / NRRL Y-2227) TaxID=1333698 RepID=A0A8J2WWF7_ZYGB2|nr:FMP40 (YPL222W) [Zygosaccharomyces parabailii]CDF88229.1 BN860_05204g1_1 [Zygosaccharomyces bailii CLIB 213]CDH14874.1 related to UPF0061 protein FMP40 [Zygosaccharomyces bailii ISA1307]
MTDGRYILNVLKETGTSRFSRSLTPDKMVSTLQRAIGLAEESDDKEEKLLSFHTPRIISQGSHFAYTVPEKRPHYKTLLKSSLTHQDLNLRMDENLEQFLSGENIFYDQDKGIFPYSMVYAGFQFGQFAGQLGDGRVVNLFDLKDSEGNWQTLQIKGSGLTPFSRFADGKAVVRSSIREFIISEALHNIGIPSSRSLQLTSLPGTKAFRGSLREPCAVVCRVAPSWLRLGNFDLFRWRPNLKGLLDLTHYAIDEVFSGGKNFPKDTDINIFRKDFFPDGVIDQSSVEKPLVEGSTVYDQFYRHVVSLNAKCVAHWQAYGFMNGVLNTDNTSIMGLSMDFGPFNILDELKPDFTPNHDDIGRRYSFENQPSAIWWNLAMFGHDLAVLLGAGPGHIDKILAMKKQTGQLPEEMEREFVGRANKIIPLVGNEYKYTFLTEYANLMGKRLGIDLNLSPNLTTFNEIDTQSQKVKDFMSTVVEPLLNLLQSTRVDYNQFFVKLQNFNGSFFRKNGISGLSREFLALFFNKEDLQELEEYQKNEIDINADSGGVRILQEDLKTLTTWAKKYSELVTDQSQRLGVARAVNPLFTPRSWMFDEVIDDLTDVQRSELSDPKAKVDTSLLQKLYLMSSYPYDSSKWNDSLRPDAQERWTNFEHENLEEKILQQASCSS